MGENGSTLPFHAALKGQMRGVDEQPSANKARDGDAQTVIPSSGDKLLSLYLCTHCI